MIGRSEEYEKMFRLEGQLWWYRCLHERVYDSLRQRFGEQRNITILDAGCGTGGLLSFLRERGYTQLTGLDGSTDAVRFCQERGLSVTLVNLNNLPLSDTMEQYDAIICNDVFCYFTETELPPFIASLARRLKAGGLLLSNNNAFKAFEGQHDLAVGVLRRFVQADFDQLLPAANLRLLQATYWSFSLSIPILLVRQWQRLQLRMGWQQPEKAKSDVYLPPVWLNETLYRLARAEQKRFPRTPFGSSLFMTIVRK